MTIAIEYSQGQSVKHKYESGGALNVVARTPGCSRIFTLRAPKGGDVWRDPNSTKAVIRFETV